MKSHHRQSHAFDINSDPQINQNTAKHHDEFHDKHPDSYPAHPGPRSPRNVKHDSEQSTASAVIVRGKGGDEIVRLRPGFAQDKKGVIEGRDVGTSSSGHSGES